MTQQAAERTMDKVDEAAPIATDMGQEADALRTEWARLKTRDMTAEEFRVLYARMDQFLEKMVSGAGVLSKNLQEIILEQRSEEHTSELQSRGHLVCRLLLAKRKV